MMMSTSGPTAWRTAATRPSTRLRCAGVRTRVVSSAVKRCPSSSKVKKSILMAS